MGLNEEIIEYAATERQNCADEKDKINGLPLGAVRVSFGYPTTLEEVDQYADFLYQTFKDYTNKDTEFWLYNPFQAQDN